MMLPWQTGQQRYIIVDCVSESFPGVQVIATISLQCVIAFLKYVQVFTSG